MAVTKRQGLRGEGECGRWPTFPSSRSPRFFCTRSLCSFPDGVVTKSEGLTSFPSKKKSGSPSFSSSFPGRSALGYPPPDHLVAQTGKGITMGTWAIKAIDVANHYLRASGAF